MNIESSPYQLILASGSNYRKMLLARLGLPFGCEAPDIDESPRPSESAADLVSRLAKEKARTIAAKHDGAVVIGADQLAVFDGRTIGKPGNREKAAAQLAAFSGRRLDFLTCVAVVCPDRDYSAQHTDTTSVFFRQLEAAEIDRYLSVEQPYDCAGAFKAEALGISLFERVQNEDPSAIVGLPLIETAKMLRQAGFCVP
jgi:septum formation protein